MSALTDSLEKSKGRRANFLFKFGLKQPPTTILYHNKTDKALDSVVDKGRSYTIHLHNKKLGGIAEPLLKKALTARQEVRGSGGALSKFSQNIGRLLTNFYCPEGGIIYDPFAGHNSRMQLVYETGRDYIGVDISHKFMEANRSIKKKLEKRPNLFSKTNTITLIEGSSSSVKGIEDETADFTITSPPYWSIEDYGNEKEQLGKNKTYNSFLSSLSMHIKENRRILKSGAYCAWFINDFSMDKIFYPFHSDLITIFKENDFIIRNVYIIDFGTSQNIAFIKTICATMNFPKRHEYCIIVRKKGTNPAIEKHIADLKAI